MESAPPTSGESGRRAMGARRSNLIQVVLAFGMTVALLSGCLSQEAVRAIEGTPGQEGTGIMFTRLPRAIKIMVTYPATDHQRTVAEQRARAAVSSLTSEEDADALPHILAVATEPDERSQGSVSVMLWDTQTEQIVGSDVYDVEERPVLGEVAAWNNYSALYVGEGEDVRGSL